MLYNDKETEDFEKLFQEDLKTARSFTQQEIETITTSMDMIMGILKKVIANPDKTAVDNEIIFKSLEILLPMVEKIKAFFDILGHSSLRKANAFYEHVKKLSLEGNEEAKVVYENLRPGYQAMLKENMDDHLQ